MKREHQHKWKYDRKLERWACRCGMVITQQQFIRRFGVMGNMDVAPNQGLSVLAREREGLHV